MPKCQNAKMPKCLNAKMPKCLNEFQKKTLALSGMECVIVVKTRQVFIFRKEKNLGLLFQNLVSTADLT
jgi:hypothetical protein